MTKKRERYYIGDDPVDQVKDDEVDTDFTHTFSDGSALKIQATGNEARRFYYNWIYNALWPLWMDDNDRK